MSAVKRDSAMANLPWPKSTARSSTSAMASETQHPDQQQGALVTDPDYYSMHPVTLGMKCSQQPLRSRAHLPHFGGRSLHLRSSYGSVPFAPSQERWSYTSHSPEIAHLQARNAPFVRSISRFGAQIAHSGPSSPKRSINMATSSSLNRSSFS